MARLLLLALLSAVKHGCYAHSSDAFDKARAMILTALDERRAAIQEACDLEDKGTDTKDYKGVYRSSGNWKSKIKASPNSRECTNRDVCLM